MPTPQRRQPIGVIARLLADPHRFSFFQAVRLLNRWFAALERRSGASAAPSPRLRFRNSLSLGFPPSEIAVLEVIGTVPAASEHRGVAESTELARADSLEPDRPRGWIESASEGDLASIGTVEMTPAFMGLLGVGGALPLFYTELLNERETYHRDTAARSFLDIFQHRAVTLFYEAWRKHRLPILYEEDRKSQFLPLVLSIAGVGQAALRERLHPGTGGLAEETVAYYAGLLQQRPISAQVIEQVVADYFKVSARVEQFIGRWFNLPSACNSSLGMANMTVGVDALVGARVWQRDARMRLTLGPMSRDKLRRFLPGGTATSALRSLLSMLTGVALEYELRLALLADEIQGIALEEGPRGTRLGWDGYLVTRPVVCPRDDAGYDIHALH